MVKKLVFLCPTVYRPDLYTDDIDKMNILSLCERRRRQ